VNVGRGSQVAAIVDHVGRQQRCRVSRVNGAEVGPVAQKAVGHRFVFFGLARAGGVDQPSARRHDGRGVLQHDALRAGEYGQIGLAPAPPDVRVAPQNAKP